MAQARVALTERQRELLNILAEKVGMVAHGDETTSKEHDDFAKATPEWQEFPVLWDGYGPDQQGCFRQDGVFADYEDVMRGVWEKFYCFFRVVADELEVKLKIDGTDHRLSVYIDPSYENSTTALVVCPKRMRVVVKQSCKSWAFEWETIDALATDLELFIKDGIEEYNRKRA